MSKEAKLELAEVINGHSQSQSQKVSKTAS